MLDLPLRFTGDADQPWQAHLSVHPAPRRGLCPDPARIDADDVEAVVEDRFRRQVGRRLAMEPVLETSAVDDARRVSSIVDAFKAKYGTETFERLYPKPDAAVEVSLD